ncbi:MAG TPA: carboxypeptidase regulatory-like domain-containing protein [Gemmatimonadaceae bacterium]|nr:carboxypeptidase regulatory-like domain-containing protein [Gemmatimonadaceae bacterium]
MRIPRAVLASLLVVAAPVALCFTSAAAQQPDSARRDTTPATLIGRVIDSAGAVIPGAEISLLHNARIRAITNDSGAFRLTGVPPGSNIFAVRRIGYQAATFSAVLKAGRISRANFPLTASIQALDPVHVADTATASHWLDQFNERRAQRRGTFITRAQIVAQNDRTGSDILRTIAGVRVTQNRSGGTVVVFTRTSPRACVPTMYVQGMPYGGQIDDFDADDIEAAEVYVGISEIPPEFDRGNRGICGVIALWMRDPHKKP